MIGWESSGTKQLCKRGSVGCSRSQAAVTSWGIHSSSEVDHKQELHLWGIHSSSEEGKYDLVLQKEKGGLQNRWSLYLRSVLGRFHVEKCPVLDMTLQERCSLTGDSLA